MKELLEAWPPDQPGLKKAFLELTDSARSKPETKWRLVSRPGVSHSFRAAATRPGRARPVYFLVDVVLSPTEPWFLSVCFYQDEITDLEELGNAVPQGLFGETGYCFDVDDYEANLLDYLNKRMIEALHSAG